jgi:L-fuculose-phosphate aldolase
MRWIIREIIECGRRLFEEGLVGARSGNISYAFGDKIFITRTGASLASLQPEDIIAVSLNARGLLDGRASSELIVHREVIKRTARRAVVHAHPSCAVALSYEAERLILPDSEGSAILGEVPVIEPSVPSASKELAHEVAEQLKERKAVVVRGHGAFAGASSPLEGWAFLSTLEHSCRILLYKRSPKSEVEDGQRGNS